MCKGRQGECTEFPVSFLVCVPHQTSFYFYVSFIPLISKGHGAKGNKQNALTLAKLLGVTASSNAGLPASEPKSLLLRDLGSP